MKVGTDGVLLGAWADMRDAGRILDIGCGTGLLALMAAQRAVGACITGVEIDPDAAAQARENVSMSPWSNRIEIVNADIRTFSTDSPYDVILCNPPYFRNSLNCPAAGRNIARHGVELSFTELAGAADRLLGKDGEMSLILPVDAMESFIGKAALFGLQPRRLTDVYTKVGKARKRSMATFSRNYRKGARDAIYLMDENGARTPEYQNLVNDFYIK